MNIPMEASWQQKLSPEFEKPYYLKLQKFIKSEYETFTCYPKREDVFAAFEHCAFNDTKVVIIGQDPYHGPNQANGLCFSVKEEVPHPPSLINIFKEVASEVGVPYPISGNLMRWADQGVLLLNATLTVREGQAGSHQKKGWETFTDAVISALSAHKNGVVFLLWGGFAKQKSKLIDVSKHHVLLCGHPSPLSANRGYWFGNGHFEKTNELLDAMGKKLINW